MFESVLESVREQTREFTLYSDEQSDIGELFPNHNVQVTRRELTPGGPEAFLALEEGGEFVGAIGLAALNGLLEPPVATPGERDGVSRGYRLLFDLLDEQLFTALERSQLVAVSREIEDRAFRVGSGVLGVSFQTLSAFDAQTDVYHHLAAETDLDIHVYAVDSWESSPVPGFAYHECETETLGRYWVLAFDGGPDRSQACGLVAKERADGYEGFWTDDPELVDRVLDKLEGV